MSLEARGIGKTYAGHHALDGVDLSVGAGELVALVGPSGSGKTTLLRILAGLETPDVGRVLFAGEDATSLAAKDRGVGFVFQHYALFRHMSVFENVAFGFRVRTRAARPAEARIEARVTELLRLVRLDGLGERRPSQLSGGQRQRVALARALAVEPRVLLLDEPFGSLDQRVRFELRRWLRGLHDELGLTSVLVTHDQDEAIDVADRVVVMNRGRIEQAGTPEELLERPASPFVVEFLGSANVFHGRADAGRATLGGLDVAVPGSAWGAAVTGYVRPFDLDVGRGPEAGLAATLTRVVPTGAVVRMELRGADGQALHAEVSRERYASLRPRVGERLLVRPASVHVFPADGRLVHARP